MAKRRRPTPQDSEGLGPVNKNNVKAAARILTPTGDDYPGAYRLLPRIRYGKASAEYFCKKNERRVELGLPTILPADSA